MIRILICFLLFPLSFYPYKGGIDEAVKVFLEKYSVNYVVKESSSTFVWTLEKKSSFLSKKKVLLKSKKSFKNKYNQATYQKIELAIFQYKSKNECKSALDSLLKCFPTECGKVTIGKDEKSFKVIPSVFIINSSSIIVSNIACGDRNDDWNKYKIDFINTFAEPGSQKIITDCGGPLKWEK